MKKVINNIINNLLPIMQPNGTMLIATNEEIIYQPCFGFANIANKIPITHDTQFLAGSVTKQFTAAAILKALLDTNIRNETLKN
ncbi:MAG: beta-lactamase family protein [Gammaproteobacteria bacterium]|nr:beta-lactamase family protein [Gammaproteobacteria bacterium]